MTWGLSLVISLSVLGGWEAFWRARGCRQESSDVPSLWCAARNSVRPDSIVLLGTSRIRADIDLDVLKRSLGRDVVQLGINATAPIAILENLADDETFHGLALVDMIPELLFNEKGVFDEDVCDYLHQLDAYISPAKRFESRLTAPLQDALVYRQPSLSIRSLLWTLSGHRRSAPSARVIDANRRIWLDFTKIDVASRGKPTPRNIERSKTGPSMDIQPVLHRIEIAVSKLQGRGGTVVFIRMPYRASRAAPYVGRYPRSMYWDVLASATSAITIHCDDFDSLSSFVCPDNSHLDYRDAAPFTSALAGVVKKALETRHRESASAESVDDVHDSGPPGK